MIEQQKIKEQAEQSLLREYPNIDILCSATRASVLAELVTRKDRLYNEPSPLLGDINKIYHDNAAYEKLLKRCITYLYSLKENQLPNDSILRIHASNFYIVCCRSSVNQLLCFVAEYPSMKQYSRGFDYTHFASKFKEYCAEWYDNYNKMLEAKYQEQERINSLTSGITGKESLKEYLQETYNHGVDITKGSLYFWNEGIKQMIVYIVGGTNKSNEEATEEYYEFAKEAEQIKERRKKLPMWLLSKEEIKEFTEESNKPF